MLRKRGELTAVVRAEEIDLVCISETHLTDTVPDKLIDIEGYSTVRQDRPTHMGGLITYVSKKIKFERLDLG